jgi:hypothetical protein
MTAEVATERESESESDNIIANVNIYWRVSAIALAVVALLGIVVNAIGGNNAYVPDVEFMESFLVFDWTHNVVHVALAAVAGVFGFGNFSSELSANVAKVVGIVYIALGFLGFVPPVTDFLSSALGLSLEVGENLIHLVLGAWGTYAGFTA